jgi:signal transduction histidine kinase
MADRSRPIRTQLFTLVLVPLISMVGLWGFATYLTVGAGYRLFNQGTLITEVAAPAEEILGAVQTERRRSMIFLAAPSTVNRTDLAAARATVDKKITSYRAVLDRSDVKRAAPDRVMALAKAELIALDGLTKLRSSVDDRLIGSRDLMAAFTELVDPITPFYAAVATFPDDAVSAEGQALQRLAHARELRARTDAVLAGTLAGIGFTADGYVQFVQAVGLMRAEYHETLVRMTEQYRQEVRAFFAKDPFVSLGQMEDAAVATGGRGAIPVDPVRWRDANATALTQLSDFQLHLAVFVQDHAKGPAYTIFGRILVAGLIGLVAIVVTVVISVRIARRLVRRLHGLSASAHTLADTQLPEVVDRLRRGEQVDVDAEAPVLLRGTDEIGEVGDAFNTVRRTAIGVAVEQAELRAGISHVFLNIARRTQSLVRKQLSLLDVMERKTVKPDDLAELFRVDHLATRMRRYSENLVILGGERPGRSWGKPVPMHEVLRGASSEAEHYERVRVLPFPPVVLSGSVVSDVIHLIAELIDNATRFSPPHTMVQIMSQSVPHGFAVEVEDRGLGMNESDLEAANRWLAHPPEFNVLALAETPRLGMFVVARIAARHDIQVSLRRSAFGGVTAIVLIPKELVAEPHAHVPTGREDESAPIADSVADEARAPAHAAESPALVGAAAGPVASYGAPSAGPSGVRKPMPPRIDFRAPESQAPAPAVPPDDAAGSAAQTHRGLPMRVRQARLAPGLRGAPPKSVPVAPLPARSPEEVRQMMSAYQRGTARGRQPITGDAGRPSTVDGTPTGTADHAHEER